MQREQGPQRNACQAASTVRNLMPGCRCAVVYLTSPTLSNRTCTKATPAVPEPFHTHPAEINDHLLLPDLFHLQPCVSTTFPQIKSTIFEMSRTPQWAVVLISRKHTSPASHWDLRLKHMNIFSLSAATILRCHFLVTLYVSGYIWNLSQAKPSPENKTVKQSS